MMVAQLSAFARLRSGKPQNKSGGELDFRPSSPLFCDLLIHDQRLTDI